MAINNAMHDVETKDTGEVPMHIRNAPVEQMKALGYHEGYLYPHNFPNHYVKQQYLPDEMLGTKYYNPNNGEVNLDEIRNDFKKE